MTNHMILKCILLIGYIISYLNDILPEFKKQTNELVVELVVNWDYPVMNITLYLKPHLNLNLTLTPKVEKNGVVAFVAPIVAELKKKIYALHTSLLNGDTRMSLSFVCQYATRCCFSMSFSVLG